MHELSHYVVLVVVVLVVVVGVVVVVLVVVVVVVVVVLVVLVVLMLLYCTSHDCCSSSAVASVCRVGQGWNTQRQNVEAHVGWLMGRGCGQGRLFSCCLLRSQKLSIE